MTANQIEYWKLQETKRHNIEVENYERPYRESATLLNYEQIATAPTIRALNLANAGAAAAAAEASYATAARQREAIETEKSTQRYNDARTDYVNVQAEQAGYQTVGYEYEHFKTQDEMNKYMSSNSTRDNYARYAVNKELWEEFSPFVNDTAQAWLNSAKAISYIY